MFGEKGHEVDEDDSVLSDYMSDMGEECDLHAATMSDVSHSERVAVQQNLSQEGHRNSPAPYRFMWETRLALCRVNVFSFTSYVFYPSFL